MYIDHPEYTIRWSCTSRIQDNAERLSTHLSVSVDTAVLSAFRRDASDAEVPDSQVEDLETRNPISLVALTVKVEQKIHWARTPEGRAFHSATMKEKWKDTEWRDQWLLRGRTNSRSPELEGHIMQG